MKTIALNTLASFLLVALLMSCKKSSDVNPSEQPYKQKIFLNEKAQAIVEADNTFGINLFKKLNDLTQEEEDNIIISPLSVSIALGMTYNGSEGETKEAMENTLGFSGLSVEEINQCYQTLINALTTIDPKVTMEIPNSIWYRDTFSVLQDFIDLNQNYFYAKVLPLDFDNPASVGIINKWVAESTHNKITEIIDGIDETTVMFLINAVYFNGTWKFEFDEQNTQLQPFYLSNGAIRQVDMMQQEATLSYTANDLFEAVDLYYGSGNFSMVILLPRETYSPDDIIAEMNAENWSAWMNSFSEANIHLSLPKFKLEYEERLNDALIGLGMGVAFDPFSANFSKINSDIQLYIGFVKHKTFIDVNEEGTEAAAVTSVGIVFTSVGGDQPYPFNVNRPFLFAIRERDTDAIIFLGKVMEPEYDQ